MTINKSLVSVAASALLVAAMTGCGSSDSGTTTTTPTQSGIQSATKVADGYVFNAKVTAYYVKDDNKTMGTVSFSTTAVAVWSFKSSITAS